MHLRCLFLSLISLLAICLFSPPSHARESDSPLSGPTLSGLGPVTAYTLPNGLKVLVAPAQAADLVTVDVWLGAGTRRETEENNGVAHFMEHLLFKGTATRKPGEIDAAIEDLGGTLNAATSYDWAHFYVTVASSDAEAALTVLADALMNAALRQEDMDSERPVILSEMARDQATPTERLTQAFNTLEFPNHPYGRPLLGTVSSVSEMRRQTVLDFYHTYYAPGNATLVIAGHITPEAGLAMARRAFGTWPARPVPADTTLPQTVQTTRQVVPLTGSVGRGGHGYLALGFRAPSVRDKPDAYVMDVLLTLLGQGGNNRLERDLKRKQKLVTTIAADYLTQRDPGALRITAAFDPGNADKVRAAIFLEIASLRETPLSEEDLAAAKHALLASYLFDAQTSSGRADALGFYSIIDSYKYDTDYITNLESVTADQVQAIARKYLNLDVYTEVTLEPRISPSLASAGGR